MTYDVIMTYVICNVRLKRNNSFNGMKYDRHLMQTDPCKHTDPTFRIITSCVVAGLRYYSRIYKYKFKIWIFRRMNDLWTAYTC